jgi:hypothetical protein
MAAIYVHPSVATLPGAADRLATLAEGGHEVVLVGGDPASFESFEGAVPQARSEAELPADVARGSWFLTADPEPCAERRVGLLTLLIGPRAAPSPRPGPRCDVEARDLATAVLEILSRDAMG